MEILGQHIIPDELNKTGGYGSLYNRFIKRCIGFILATLFLFILWPFYLIIAIAIKLDDGGPVFYRPLRGGYHKVPFRIFKFRTMVRNADKIGGGTTALNDPRITKIGNFLRKTKLDEIPQLFNIINGTMCFIGPRPELLRYTEKYKGDEEDILNVRPGITDFSSVEFINLDELVGSENADEIYEKYVLKRKNRLRIKYAHEVSFKTDFILFMNTVKGVLAKAFGFIFLHKH
ncbi:MAG: sugar transferase [Muribaculaceae bacterium]|nr:sugar transferase [Muribaculaceae bacterium]